MGTWANRAALAAALVFVSAGAVPVSAQLIIPTGQNRMITGEGTSTTSGSTVQHGPYLDMAFSGDYGTWTGNVSLDGFITGSASQTGGFNGTDTITLESFSMSLGGGNGPGTSAEASMTNTFSFTFDVPSTVAYELDAGFGNSGPSMFSNVSVNFVTTLSLVGPNGEVFRFQTSADNGYSVAVTDHTGTLTPGSYTLAFVGESEVSFFVPPDDTNGTGGGGGAGGATPIVAFRVMEGAACPADRNGDNAVDASDITAFLSAWFADRANGTLSADFNGSGVVDASDITAYLSAWFAARANGC